MCMWFVLGGFAGLACTHACGKRSLDTAWIPELTCKCAQLGAHAPFSSLLGAWEWSGGEALKREASGTPADS